MRHIADNEQYDAFVKKSCVVGACICVVALLRFVS